MAHFSPSYFIEEFRKASEENKPLVISKALEQVQEEQMYYTNEHLATKKDIELIDHKINWIEKLIYGILSILVINIIIAFLHH